MDLPKGLLQALYTRLQHPIQPPPSPTKSISPPPSVLFPDQTRSKRPPLSSSVRSAKPARSSQPEMIETPEPFPLLLLPLDLLHHLSTFLPPSAQISLRLTSHSLFQSLPEPRTESMKAMDECAKRAVRFALEESLERPLERVSFNRAEHGDSRKEKRRKPRDGLESRVGNGKGRMRCALCKALYPLSLFDLAGFITLDAPSPAPTKTSGIGAGAVDLRNRVCKWHDGRFHRTVKRGAIEHDYGSDHEADKETMVKEGWEMREACMHCGTVFAWEGRCKCECESCWRRGVWTFTRILEEEEGRVVDDVILRWIF